MLVQGPGGNTSFKSGNVMWIKASGTQLSDAGAAGIFTPVKVDESIADIDRKDGQPPIDVRIDPSDGHRPSIETGFHALLPWKYVFHYHSVQALAHLTSREGSGAAVTKLADLDPVLVSYHKPGADLSQAIRRAVERTGSKVILLENHGMIVCGASLVEIERLLEETECRLKLEPRFHDCQSVPKNFPGWSRIAGSESLAQGPLSAARVTAGCYFPDQVVFTGRKVPSIPPAEFSSRPEVTANAVLVPGSGIYLRDGLPDAAHDTILCLVDVLLRIPEEWNPQPLSSEETAELIHWDAEKYRQKLARKAAD